MNSSNSFNICPRCGNSNSLNAKYCSRCGAQLKVPTEAVVCHKCHTRNSSLANFCRNCGATLKVGAQTKICPRCGREIGAEENMCACGYSFVTMQQTEPRRADVSSTNREKKKEKKRGKDKQVEQPVYTESTTTASQPKEKKVKQKKSGRGFALFAFLLLAAFVVVILLPASARGPLAGFDKGLYHPVDESAPEASVDKASQLYAEDEGSEQGEEQGDGEQSGEQGGDENTGDNGNQTETPDKLDHNIYGWDLINDIIKLFGEDAKAEMSEYEGGAFKYVINEYFGSATFIMVVMFAVFILTAFFHLLVCLARIISPKRSKHPNFLYLILAVITTVFVAMMMLSHLIPGDENAFKTFFAPVYNGVSCEYGLVLILIPVYYWFFWLYSYIAKKKTPKKEKKEKVK